MNKPAPAIRLDVHAHIIPLRRDGVDDLAGVSWSARDRLVVDGDELSKRELYDPDALTRWMDAQGIDEAWVSIPPTLYRAGLDADGALRWTERVNAALLRVTAPTGRRLAPLYHLPVQHPAVAVEVAAAATANGQSRFAMPAGDAARGCVLSDASYAPLWTELERAGAFLFLHPARSCDPRLEPFSLPNLLGGPTETAIAAAHLAMSGIVGRHPRVTFCLAHGGGTTPAVAGRWQRGQDTERPGAYVGPEPVRVALRRFCVDCITHDAAALEAVVATFGADRVLFGSDWPFDMGLTRPHDQLASVPGALRRAMFVDNPTRLLGEPVPAGGADAIR